ncbi:hypothetical protein MGN70_003347 [Eutypa lata]|uniref:Uncharacterized protein n=1 Tax=Eutypa lata (strain UCR-EL1) TaxID=1287681 RepID=M7S6H0_EUTLA|nr:hypothetical protein UCREL1_11420 [Eutypa lata UCREL1]KAI1255282.1 hypothetical protein MGN70_003347 [Eutypa lata]
MATRAWHCAICKTEQDTDIDSHISERHSSPESRKRIVNGTEVNITDDQYVRANASGRGQDPGAALTKPVRTAPPPPGILESLGIKEDDIADAEVEVVGGASLSDIEAKLVFEAIEEYCGFKMDRAKTLVSFLGWGFLCSFGEEKDRVGGWYVKEHVTSGNGKIFLPAANLLTGVQEKFQEAGVEHDFTFRRFGRYLAPIIIKSVTVNPSLAKFKVRGTPISNRLGVKPSLFLACTSIFEYIKPMSEWTEEEYKAWDAQNSSARKMPKGQVDKFQPQDLRIDPEMAQRFREEGVSDFARRYKGRFVRPEDYEMHSKGQRMFDEMLAKSNARAGMGTAGLGSSTPSHM